MKILTGVILTAALMAGAAQAAVTDKSAAGFELTETATIAAPPAKVWAALMTPGAWWSSAHAFSGDAKNYSMDLAGHCFCEKLPHGYARHMEIVYSDGATMLRLFGGLGPMQMTGAAGHMNIVLKRSGAATALTLTYDIGGYMKGGMDGFAPVADRVMGEQVGRLKTYVETGKPQ